MTIRRGEDQDGQDQATARGQVLSRRAGLAAAMMAMAMAAADGATPAGNGDDFLALSEFLTGRRRLDAGLAAQFFAALGQRDPLFNNQLEALAAAIALRAPKNIDALDLGTLAETDRQCALAIIACWYAGVAGTGAAAVVISFEQALLYDATSDALSVPSFCDWGRDDWTKPPPPAPASGVAAAAPRPMIWR